MKVTTIMAFSLNNSFSSGTHKSFDFGAAFLLSIDMPSKGGLFLEDVVKMESEIILQQREEPFQEKSRSPPTSKPLLPNQSPPTCCDIPVVFNERTTSVSKVILSAISPWLASLIKGVPLLKTQYCSFWKQVLNLEQASPSLAPQPPSSPPTSPPASHLHLHRWHLNSWICTPCWILWGNRGRWNVWKIPQTLSLSKR